MWLEKLCVLFTSYDRVAEWIKRTAYVSCSHCSGRAMQNIRLLSDLKAKKEVARQQ